MISKIEVQVTTPLNPTESRDRVEDAILNLFPDADIDERHGELIADTHSLERVSDRLREQNIVSTAREVFVQGLEGDTFSFDLKKQAAFNGIVNFAVGNPDELGDVHVRVRVEEPDPRTVIDEIAPSETDDTESR